MDRTTSSGDFIHIINYKAFRYYQYGVQRCLTVYQNWLTHGRSKSFMEELAHGNRRGCPVEDGEYDCCVICKAEINDHVEEDSTTANFITASCGHNYHAECLQTWWESSYLNKKREDITKCVYCTHHITDISYHRLEYHCHHPPRENAAKALVAWKAYGCPIVPAVPKCSDCDRLKGTKQWRGLFLATLKCLSDRDEYTRLLRRYEASVDKMCYWEQWEQKVQERLDAAYSSTAASHDPFITTAEVAFVLDYGHAMSLEHALQSWWSGVADDMIPIEDDEDNDNTNTNTNTNNNEDWATNDAVRKAQWFVTNNLLPQVHWFWSSVEKEESFSRCWKVEV